LVATLLGGLAVLVAIKHGLPVRLQKWLGRHRTGVGAQMARGAGWGLRAVGANILLAAYLHHGGFEWDVAFMQSGKDYFTGPVNSPPWDYFQYWPFFQNLTAFCVLLVSIVASVLLGRQERKLRDWRILIAPVNTALIAAIIAVYQAAPFLWP
jgi:hypothetical protein